MTNTASTEPSRPSPWPDHLLSLEEWDAYDEELHTRAELVEGVLVVSPSARGPHNLFGAGLTVALNVQLAPRAVAIPEVEVLIDAGPPPTVRKPDVVVVHRASYDERYRYDPGDVLAAFEILSAGSRRTDRVAKLAEYAEAGIAHYGIVDREEQSLSEFALVDGGYRLVAEYHGTATLALGAVLDLDALAGPPPT